MRKALCLGLLLFTSSLFGGREPQWTETERFNRSDAVFAGVVQKIEDVSFEPERVYRKATVRIDKVKKFHKLLKGTHAVLFFQKQIPNSEAYFVSLIPDEKAIFYARAETLSNKETVLFLQFPSDVQKP